MNKGGEKLKEMREMIEKEESKMMIVGGGGWKKDEVREMRKFEENMYMKVEE